MERLARGVAFKSLAAKRRERERVQLLRDSGKKERARVALQTQVNDASVLEADNVRSFAATIRSAR